MKLLFWVEKRLENGLLPTCIHSRSWSECRSQKGEYSCGRIFSNSSTRFVLNDGSSQVKGSDVVVGTANCGVAPLQTMQDRRMEVCTRTMHPWWASLVWAGFAPPAWLPPLSLHQTHPACTRHARTSKSQHSASANLKNALNWEQKEKKVDEIENIAGSRTTCWQLKLSNFSPALLWFRLRGA